MCVHDESYDRLLFFLYVTSLTCNEYFLTELVYPSMSRPTLPRTGIPSTANIAGHPIHPILVPFPIAFLIGALGADFGYLVSGDFFWARASLWLVGIGLLSGVLAALPGLIDYFTIRRARKHRAGWIHFLGNVAVLIFAFISLLLRWPDPAAAVWPWGLGLSVLIAALLGITGWYGGELSYRYRIGVFGDEPEAEDVTAETATSASLFGEPDNDVRRDPED